MPYCYLCPTLQNHTEKCKWMEKKSQIKEESSRKTEKYFAGSVFGRGQEKS